MNVWIAGLNRDNDHLEIIGIFDTKSKAIDVCRTVNHWIAPIELNKDLGDEPMEITNGYYPLVEKVAVTQ